MKRLRTSLERHAIFLCGLVLPVIILAPRLLDTARVASATEASFLKALPITVHVLTLRYALLILILATLTMLYCLYGTWYGRRRAAMTVVVLSCIPMWLLVQFAAPTAAVAVSALILSLLSFDKAGRSNNATPWYSLSGLAFTGAWLLEPVGATLLILLSAIALASAKPRYITHIVRQSSLIAIILVVVVAALTTVSIRLNLGFESYMSQQLAVQAGFNPQVVKLVSGPSSYHFGLPGVAMIPLAIVLIAGLGLWQLAVSRKRPRNLFMIVWPLLLLLPSLAFRGITLLVLLLVATTGISMWAVSGLVYLRSSWARLFPHNRLAKNLSTAMFIALVASMALYSFWYINRAWSGSAQTEIDTSAQWRGEL